ncbi:MAG: helix-turn-helix domain-containing protein [Rickettsia sp.]|jgi:hypothetical protein|nr:helix-turn-helix domain-containing protein [Rickettsia sp.]
MDAKIKLRLSWIKLYKQLEHAGKVCEHYGISRFTLRKWYKRYEVLGKNGLCDISIKPKNFPFQKRSEVDEKKCLKKSYDSSKETFAIQDYKYDQEFKSAIKQKNILSTKR